MSNQFDDHDIDNNPTEPILPKDNTNMKGRSSYGMFQSLQVSNNNKSGKVNSLTEDEMDKKEQQKLNNSIKGNEKSVSIFKLQFALRDCSDVCTIIIGILASLALGTNAMIFELLLGNSINNLSLAGKIVEGKH